MLTSQAKTHSLKSRDENEHARKQTVSFAMPCLVVYADHANIRKERTDASAGERIFKGVVH
jgi:hypothetical protein